jgi:hypothetical protein
LANQASARAKSAGRRGRRTRREAHWACAGATPRATAPAGWPRSSWPWNDRFQGRLTRILGCRRAAGRESSVGATQRPERLTPVHWVEWFHPLDRVHRLDLVDRIGRVDPVDRVGRIGPLTWIGGVGGLSTFGRLAGQSLLGAVRLVELRRPRLASVAPRVVAAGLISQARPATQAR